MLINKLKFTAAAMAASLAFTVMASAATTNVKTENRSDTVRASQNQCETQRSHFKMFHHGGMNALSQVTGMTEQALSDKYPQKTAWQIAYQLNKLDELKKVFLSNQKQFFDKLVADNKITADESSKMYADLQKRVALIDGKNIVIAGKPGFMPDFKKKAEN